MQKQMQQENAAYPRTRAGGSSNGQKDKRLKSDSFPAAFSPYGPSQKHTHPDYDLNVIRPM